MEYKDNDGKLAVFTSKNRTTVTPELPIYSFCLPRESARSVKVKTENCDGEGEKCHIFLQLGQ